MKYENNEADVHTVFQNMTTVHIKHVSHQTWSIYRLWIPLQLSLQLS